MRKMRMTLVWSAVLAFASIAKCGVVSGGLSTVLTAPKADNHYLDYGSSSFGGHGVIASTDLGHGHLSAPTSGLSISSGQSVLGSGLLLSGQHGSGLAISSGQSVLGAGSAISSDLGAGISGISSGLGGTSGLGSIGTGLVANTGNVVDGGTTFSHRIQPVPIGVPLAVPLVITHPVAVPVAVARPVIVPRPVPVEVPHAVPVQVPRPVPVAVPRPVPVPVRHPVYVKVPKPIPVTVPRPYPVIVPKPVRVIVATNHLSHHGHKFSGYGSGGRGHGFIIPGGLKGGLSDVLSGGILGNYAGGYASDYGSKHSHYVSDSFGGHYSGSGSYSNFGNHDYHHHHHHSHSGCKYC